MKMILNFLLIYGLFCNHVHGAQIKFSQLPVITETEVAQDDFFPLIDNSIPTAKRLSFLELDKRFLFLDGKAAGQTAFGGTGAGDSITLKSTSNVTKGDILLAPDLGEQVGIGVASSTHQIHIELDAQDNFFIDGRTNPRTVTVGAVRQLHTAGISGSRANFIDVSNANAYNDTKGFHVNMDLDGNSSSLSSAGILLSADVQGTTNATHDYMSFTKTGAEGVNTVLHAIHITSSDAIDPIHHLSGAVIPVGQGWIEEAGPSWTDATTAFGSSGTNAQIFSADNDRIYVSNGAEQFSLIEVVLAIAGSHDALVGFEYSKGAGVWGSLPVSDGTGGFTASGNIDFEIPIDWVTDTVNGVTNRYWVRMTRTRNSLSTPPTESTIKILKPAEYFWDKDGKLSINEVTTIGPVGVGIAVPSENLDMSGNLKMTGHAYSTIPSTMIPTGITQTIDWDNGAVQVLDLGSATGNVTLTLSNLNAGATIVLKVIQGAIARDLVWPAAVLWQGGTSPVISTVNDAVDMITLLYDGTNYYGNFGQDYQ